MAEKYTTAVNVTKAQVKAAVVRKSALTRAKARLRNLERKRKIVRGLVDGEIAATEIEMAWLTREHKNSGKHERLRVEMRMRRAEVRIQALRAAR